METILYTSRCIVMNHALEIKEVPAFVLNKIKFPLVWQLKVRLSRYKTHTKLKRSHEVLLLFIYLYCLKFDIKIWCKYGNFSQFEICTQRSLTLFLRKSFVIFTEFHKKLYKCQHYDANFS